MLQDRLRRGMYGHWRGRYTIEDVTRHHDSPDQTASRDHNYLGMYNVAPGYKDNYQTE